MFDNICRIFLTVVHVRAALKVLIELKLEFESPAMIYQVNGQAAPWIRYAEWLLTCPVRSSLCASCVYILPDEHEQGEVGAEKVT